MNTILWLFIMVLPLGSEPAKVLDTAIEHYRNGEYRAAVNLLSPAGRKPDASPEIKYWLGKTYLKIHEWDKAVKEMENAVRMKPADAEYHLWLGRAYGARAENRFFGFNDARRLLKEFKKAKDLAPENIDIRFDLLEFYIQAPGIVGGSSNKAWAEAETIAELNPRAGYTARATIYERKEKWDLALKEYTQATLEYPDNADVYKDLAQYLYDRKDYAGALESALKTTGLNNDSVRGRFLAAASRIHLGTDLEKAKSDMLALASSRLGEEDPALEEIYYLLGVLYHKNGERKKSEESLHKALEIHPNYRKAEEYLKKID